VQRIFIKTCFLFAVKSVCRVKRFSLAGKRFADDEEVETEVRKWLRQEYGTSGSMLVEDMSRNKCFYQVRISHLLRFISICDLITDSPSYVT
jgi:hypothetical protein